MHLTGNIKRVNKLGWLINVLLAFACWLAVNGICAASPTNAVITIRSSSRQFVVSGVPVSGRSARLLSGSTTNNLLRLDPALLAVSCERIKQALLQELNLRDIWQSKIHLIIRFTTANSQPINIQSTYYTSGWRFCIILPDEIEGRKLARAIVEVLLLELANRDARPQLAEAPLWLAEGLTGCLMESAGLDLVLKPYTRTLRLEVKPDPLKSVRDRLRFQKNLTFNQLSHPTPEMLSGPNWQAYQDCAQLFVGELLQLRQGRDALKEMLRLLPQHYNWQIAFLKAFHPIFSQLLDVEKWWALMLVNASGYNQLQGWRLETSLEKLDQALRLPAEARYSTNALPARIRITLQKFIESWGYPQQKELLQLKINQLNALRLNVSPEVLPLIMEYIGALESYLERRDGINYASTARGLPAANPRIPIREVISKLDSLDARCQALRQPQDSLATTTP